MLTFRQNFTIAAGATNNNVVAGDLMQFLPFDAHLKFWQTQSAAGLETRITVATMVVGGSGQPIRPNINAAGDIVTLDDSIAESVGSQTQQVIFTVSNPTAGVLTTTVMVVATPI